MIDIFRYHKNTLSTYRALMKSVLSSSTVLDGCKKFRQAFENWSFLVRSILSALANGCYGSQIVPYSHLSVLIQTILIYRKKHLQYFPKVPIFLESTHSWKPQLFAFARTSAARNPSRIHVFLIPTKFSFDGTGGRGAHSEQRYSSAVICSNDTKHSGNLKDEIRGAKNVCNRKASFKLDKSKNSPPRAVVAPDHTWSVISLVPIEHSVSAIARALSSECKVIVLVSFYKTRTCCTSNICSQR